MRIVLLLARVDAELAALPPWAPDQFLAEDLERARRLIASKRGTDEDREFLEKRMLGEEIPRFWAAAGRRAPTPPRYAAGLWIVTFKDGRKLAGTIVEVNERHLKIKAKLGTMSIQKEDVLRVEPYPE